MGYYIDLKAISIAKYCIKLQTSYLVPSRRILKENTDSIFDVIMNMGLKTVFEVQQALNTKVKLNDFSKKSGIPAEYLVILLREINSINPKPNSLKEIPGIPVEIILQLEKEGIRNTYQLYGLVKTKSARSQFAQKFKINDKQVLELTKLIDLSRIKWASPVFVRILFDLGYDTVQKVANVDCEALHKKINNINMKKGYFKGNIGLNDTRIFIDAAKDVTIEVEY